MHPGAVYARARPSTPRALCCQGPSTPGEGHLCRGPCAARGHLRQGKAIYAENFELPGAIYARGRPSTPQALSCQGPSYARGRPSTPRIGHQGISTAGSGHPLQYFVLRGRLLIMQDRTMRQKTKEGFLWKFLKQVLGECSLDRVLQGSKKNISLRELPTLS